MPNLVSGNVQEDYTFGEDITIKYEYAKGIDLSPDSELSKRILLRIPRMAEESFRKMSMRHKKWNEIDNTLKVYIKPDEQEKALKEADPRRPTSIVVPYSYAAIETIMAYLTKAFLTDQIFQYDGTGPEDTIPAKLLELTANQQVRRFKSDLEMHTSMRDSLTYGLGASTVVWSEVWGKKTVMEDRPIYNMWGDAIGANKVKQNKDALLFEGNETIAIDPYRFLPDPNVSIHNIQAGDFCGWIEFQSYNKLLSDENTGNGLCNVRYLRTEKFRSITSTYTTDNSSRVSKRDPVNSIASASVQNYNTLIHMYVQVIPKEWKLPGQPGNEKGEYPEVWLFTVANESIVLRAQPLGLNHNRFPVVIASPDYDGYSITPISRMELIDGLQTTLNWLFNSHIANVRKAINDMLVVDPSLVNMADLENPAPGKLIRLRRSAWGRGVEHAIMQLGITDITRMNMQDAEQIMNLMQKASAATDATMGIQRSGGERVTAAEYSGTTQMAISRLEHIARMISKQYFIDCGYFYASHTQQLMSKLTYDRAVGTWPDVLLEEFGQSFDINKPIKIDPFSVLCDFDVIYKDGATATADQLGNDFWTRNFQAILSSDKLGMFDITRIFRHMARLNGAKNVGDFINKGGMLSAITQPDNQVMDQVSSGKLVELGQGGGQELESLMEA